MVANRLCCKMIRLLSAQASKHCDSWQRTEIVPGCGYATADALKVLTGGQR